MTAHDPPVTLTKAEIERLCDALEDSDAEYRVEQRVAREVEHLIAARLAPIRALADEWEAKHGTCGCPTNGGEQLRAALEASVSASQDHDGAEGQSENQTENDLAWPTTSGLAYCPDHGIILPGDGRCPYRLLRPEQRASAESVARHPGMTFPPGESVTEA